MKNAIRAQEIYDNMRPDEFYIDYKTIQLECKVGHVSSHDIEFDVRHKINLKDYALKCPTCKRYLS